MKKNIMSAILASSLLVGSVAVAPTASAGIPVIDAGSIAQAVQQVIHMKTQIDNQISQIRNMEAQYKSITGSRNLGQLLNDPAMRNYLPQDYANLYDAIKSGNTSKLSRSLDNIAKQEKTYASQKNGADRYATQSLITKASSIQALEAQSKRLDNIQNLMGQINLATDPKAAQDLSNRLAAEQAMIQSEQVRINLMSQLNEANLRLAREQRDKESVDAVLGKRLLK